MPHRISDLRDPVELWHDGERVVAERGEPIAVALIAADRVPLARSPKLHRPRSPYCLRGACDGCLARVDGAPNVATCMVAAQGGERIETQNVLGTRGVDLLRASDFLFPSGIDHHRLLAGVRGVSGVVQSFARRVAGLGKLPSEIEPPHAARRSEREVLVVGAGAAGLSAAAELGSLAPLVVDDALRPGGSLGALDPHWAISLVENACRAGAEIRSATTALGLFREPQDARDRLHALLVGPDGAELVVARAVLLAPGAHDPVLAFDGNDLPMVMSARAALALWRAGVAPADRVAVAGRGRFERRFRELAAEQVALTDVDPSALIRASGRGRLSSVLVRAGKKQQKVRAGALLVDGPGAPSFELGVQAGAIVRFEPAHGYVLERDDEGSVAPGVWVAGSAALSSDSISNGARVARALRAAL